MSWREAVPHQQGRVSSRSPSTRRCWCLGSGIPSLVWREWAGPGHWPCPWVCCVLVPRQCCLSHPAEPCASLLHLAGPSLPAGSCSWSRRHTKLGDLPRKQGTSPTGFVVCAGAVTSLWVPISECCRSCFSELRCPPGSACLVRSEGWERGWCPSSALLTRMFLSLLWP